MTTTTVKTENDIFFKITETDSPTTEDALTIEINKPHNAPNRMISDITLSAEDARALAITLKLIAEKIIAER